jgi:hypothetical protein
MEKKRKQKKENGYGSRKRKRKRKIKETEELFDERRGGRKQMNEDQEGNR